MLWETGVPSIVKRRVGSGKLLYRAGFVFHSLPGIIIYNDLQMTLISENLIIHISEPYKPKAAKLWFLADRVNWETGVPSIAKRRVMAGY